MTRADLPCLRVADAVGNVLRTETLRSLGVDVLGPWLRGRRWFGGKGRTAVRVSFRDVTPLFSEEPPSAVARLEVELEGAGAALYQLPLALAGEGAAVEAPIARIESADRAWVLFDAVEDPRFRERLGAQFAAGRAFSGNGTAWRVEAVDEAGRQAIPPGTAGALGRAEQSNTSIRYSRAILKLYRRLEHGENPDVEIGRFLTTRTSFRNVPRLYGTIHFEDAFGERMVAGMLQALVPGSRDGWAHALARLRTALDAADAAAGSFAVEAARLGEITRGLHDALASDPSDPEFAPEPIGRDSLEEWRRAVRSQAQSSFALLERRRSGAEAPRSAVDAMLDRRADVLAEIDRLVASLADDPGRRIRHHGDYHLGQVLRSADGDFLVIDFEGEPARPLAERRRKHSPARDVAGMLRSFDYAAAAALEPATSPDGERAARAERWYRECRNAFLRAYRESGRAEILPRTAEGFERLCILFELEKALYEMAYELNNRPDWVAIPLRGLAAILERTSA